MPSAAPNDKADFDTSNDIGAFPTAASNALCESPDRPYSRIVEAAARHAQVSFAPSEG